MILFILWYIIGIAWSTYQCVETDTLDHTAIFSIVTAGLFGPLLIPIYRSHIFYQD